MHLRFKPIQRVYLFLVLVAATLQATAAPSPLLHKPAPLFVRHDLEGHPIRLREYRGKVVLLNFWATWCAPCQLELRRFAGWQRENRSDLQVIAVSMDDSEAPVRAMTRTLNLNFPIAMGDAKLGSRYGGVLGLPLSFLIDRSGVIVARFQGETDQEALNAQLRQLLAQH
ncbi:MAG: TlpA disulfide reductase family protein [Terracidiphilus sp.]